MTVSASQTLRNFKKSLPKPFWQRVRALTLLPHSQARAKVAYATPFKGIFERKEEMGQVEIIYWKWEEAFDKFGFDDGDGLVQTHVVEDVLIAYGYEVDTQMWGCHNTIIISITEDGKEFMPDENSDVCVGYDCPREYLPKEIIKILDDEI